MRFLLLPLFLLSTYAIPTFAGEKVLPEVPFAVYILPSQLLPFAYSGGLTMGVEYPLFRQFAFTGEGTIYYYGTGFMVRGNVKYYFKHIKGDDEQPYIALEYGYKTQEYEGQDNIKEPGNKPGAAIKYDVYKFVNTLGLKYGRQLYFNKWLYFDFYAGLGMRYKVVNNNLTDDQLSSLYHWHEGFIESFTNSDFSGFTPTLSIGVKIGYRFK